MRKSTSILSRTATAIFAGLVAGAITMTPALAESKRLSVITSAVYKRSFDKYVVPRMKELYDVEVVSSPFLSGEALAKAIAQKGDPQVSVFLLDEGPWQQGDNAGLWDQIDPANVPNLKDVPENFRDADGRGTAMMLGLLGILYDSEALASGGVAEPVSLFDLWAPAVAGRISIQQFSSTFAFGLLSYTTRAVGGDWTQSFDPGFAKIAELSPNVATFSGPAAQLIQLFQQKEIWMAWGAHFTAMQAAAAGAPVKWVAPSEGLFGYGYYAAIAKGAPNKREAEQLIDLILSPEYQKIMAETDFTAPANVTTVFDPAFAAKYPVKPQDLAKATSIPWALYNEQRVKLNERWQREIER